MDQETMFQGTACTLEQVLHSRSDRQDRQQALLKGGCSCLISFGLNVPGAVKQSPALRQVFDEGLSQLRQLLPGALRGQLAVQHLLGTVVAEPKGEDQLDRDLTGIASCHGYILHTHSPPLSAGHRPHCRPKQWGAFPGCRSKMVIPQVILLYT